MKILHIISGDLWAGAESQSFSLIEGLTRLHGLEQHVIIFNEGLLGNKLRDAGYCVHFIDESRKSLPNMICHCRKVIKKTGFDIIHAHGFKENFIGGIAVRLGHVGATVRTHHGKGLIGGSKRYSIIERLNEKLLTDAIIAVSFDLKKFLVDCGFSDSKIAVIHNGINSCSPIENDRALYLKNSFALEDDSLIVGTIGRLVPIKNHEVMLRGAREVIRTNCKVKFMIVGDGQLRQSLESLANELDIASQVIFTGFRHDARDFLGIFDIFVMTSLHEGIPISLLEAMSMKKVVITTAVGGMSEVIENNISGLLVPSDDPKAFAKACLMLIENKDLRESLSNRACQRVQDAFSLDSSVDKTFILYKKALGK